MATARAQRPTWHPVTPQIADPDLAPAPAAFAPPGAQLGAYPEPYPPERAHDQFFSKHKFAIVVSAVVLIILIVVLYVYLTRRSSKQKGSAFLEKGGQPGGGTNGGGALPENFDVKELDRLRAARQLQRGHQARGGAARASAHDGSLRQPGAYPPAPRASSSPAPRASPLAALQASASDAGSASKASDGHASVLLAGDACGVEAPRPTPPPAAASEQGSAFRDQELVAQTFVPPTEAPRAATESRCAAPEIENVAAAPGASLDDFIESLRNGAE